VESPAIESSASMQRLILHFGTHKTGSSSLQYYLSKADLGHDWQYPNWQERNHSGMVQSVASSPESLVAKSSGTKSEREAQNEQKYNREIYINTLRNYKTSNLIVSAEGASLLNAQELIEFKELNENEGYETLAVGYFREPKSYIESMFQQRVRGLNEINLLDIADLYPKYRKIADNFESAFGTDNVSLRKFDKGGDIVDDFLDHLGIQRQEQPIPRLNKSLSLPALKLLYAYRKFGPPRTQRPQDWKINDLFISRLRMLNGQQFRLSTAITDPILNAYADETQWVETKMGSRFDQQVDQYENAISTESQLFEFEPEALSWLLSQAEIERTELAQDPRVVADWVHKLFKMLANQFE